MTFEKERFAGAVELWKEWNDKINVVSRKDIDNLYEHHILHSLAICQYLSANGFSGTGASLQTAALDDRNRGEMAVCGPGLQAGNRTESFLDVGCGGGFPGVPLAMVMPEAKFTLCDSIGKKVKVAQAVADGLGLKNVKCVNARAEALPGQFDWVISRAVTSLDNFYPWVKGKFRKGILYLKGGDVNEEIAVMCRKCGVNPSKVSVWPIRDWLEDDYFSEKFVIHVRK